MSNMKINYLIYLKDQSYYEQEYLTCMLMLNAIKMKVIASLLFKDCYLNESFLGLLRKLVSAQL